MRGPKLFTSCLLSALGVATHAMAGSYAIAGRLPIPDESGWDIPSVDAEAHLLYLSRATHVAVMDTETGQVVGNIDDTPGVHGIAVAADLGRGFISVGKANQVAVFDLKTRAILARIDAGMKPDTILYDIVTRRVFAFNGHSDDVSVIDAAAGRVIATVALGGDPEFGRADGSGHVYVNLEDKNQLLAIDARTLAVTARWPLPGCDGPTGLALDALHHRSFSVCANSTMSILDTETGRSVATLPIGKGVDGAEFDPQAQNAFSANGEGSLTIVHEVDANHFVVAQTLVTQRGARTIALDLKTHRLYLPTASFGIAKPSATEARPKPPILPGSFVVLVVAPATLMN
jgi:YVTN family beta-propeller protein